MSCVWGVCVYVCVGVQKLWRGRKEKQRRWWKGSRSKNSCLGKVMCSSVGMSPSTTPATWNKGGCLKVPRLPRQQPQRHSLPLRPKRATGASPMPYVPRLPHKVKVDVTKYHACHVKRRWMSQSATPATPTAEAPSRPLRPKCATGASPMPYVPRLPRKVTIHVAKCHTCHVKRRWMSQSATPATPTAAAPSRPLRPKCATGASPMPYVPRLPHKVKVDVTKYHACHVKRRWLSQSATPATPTAAAPFPATPAQARHRSQPNAIRATPATQSEGRCHQVPRLPRERKVDISKCHACHANSRSAIPGHSGPSAPPEPAQCHTCHACHANVWWQVVCEQVVCEQSVCEQVVWWQDVWWQVVCEQVVWWQVVWGHVVWGQVVWWQVCHVKRRWMSQSATPATPTAAVPFPATPAQARHRSQPSAIRATPATQSEGRCHQVPRLPRETKVDVSKCNACHANSRGTIPGHSGPSAPPEPAQCHTCHACHANVWWLVVCEQVVCEQSVCEQVVWWQDVWWQVVCEQVVWWQVVCGHVVWGQVVWWQVVCGHVVCVMSKLCEGGGRRWKEKADGGGGIQNQKQEPHTKMWGKKERIGDTRARTHELGKHWQTFLSRSKIWTPASAAVEKTIARLVVLMGWYTTKEQNI